LLAQRFRDAFRDRGATPALVGEDGAPTSYQAFHEAILAWQARLPSLGVRTGDVVALEGGYSLELLACFWALACNGNILSPLTPQSPGRAPEFQELCEVAHFLRFDGGRLASTETRQVTPRAGLLKDLRDRGGSGLILFSSGTEGTPKVVLHDLQKLLLKYDRKLQAHRTLLFLVFDHIAGLDTLFYTLCAGGCCILLPSRSPEAVARALATHKVEVFPTTPSFLGLLLAAEALFGKDLSSLKVIAYGSEAMPPHLLSRLGAAFPGVRLLQRYGTTELGSPPARSREEGTLWMELGGEHVKTKVVDGLLWIKSDTAMLGYLNAPSPFDDEGYVNTGDAVETEGRWIKVLGRRSQMINVGGEKVHPSEVENVLLQMPNVEAASVFGEPNALLGQIVVARLTLREPRSPSDLKREVREFCRTRLPPYQVPARVLLAEEPLHGYRFKKAPPSP
jgi:acyl-CoA synthetase (AMP-forming)/AMP-acid ligase II